MGIKLEDIQVGRAFITKNEGVIRLVVLVQSEMMVYRAFLRATGEYAGIEPCLKSTFIRKVVREATPEEYNRMNITEAEQAERRENK